MTGAMSTNTMHGDRNWVNLWKLILSALVPCVLGIFTIVFTLQQQSLSKIQHEVDQQRQLDAQQQTLFDAYIHDISNLLLHTSDANKTNEKNVFLYVRIKTLTALRNLNTARKTYILLFLYESGFLRDPDFDLKDADLNDVQLIGPYKLDGLYLRNVFWRNALLIDCSLNKAVFDRSNMANARFINSSLEWASFSDAILDNVHFTQTSVLSINFTGTSLVRADFLDADVVQSINFMNADLLYARFTENQLQGKRVRTLPNDFRHVRFPNGSFGPVDSQQNLVKNGDAELQCSTRGRKEWQIIQISNSLSVTAIHDMPVTNMSLGNYNWGKCMFRMINKTARVSQYIDLHVYSRLIAMDKLMFSSFAFFGCSASSSASSSAPYVEVSIHGSNGNLIDNTIYINPIEDVENGSVFMHPYGIERYRLQNHTAKVRISFGVRSTLKDGVWCYFDNLTFTIHKYHN